MRDKMETLKENIRSLETNLMNKQAEKDSILKLIEEH